MKLLGGGGGLQPVQKARVVFSGFNACMYKMVKSLDADQICVLRGLTGTSTLCHNSFNWTIGIVRIHDMRHVTFRNLTILS